MNRNKTRVLVESAIMVALATVLSIFKIVEMPYGGSVTCASMLPIVVLSYRHGVRYGMGAGLVYAVIQQLLGLKYLSYFTTPLSIVALILLDYLLAFCFVGLGGVFRKRIKSQSAALVLGAALACFIRYLCHTVSGATVWAGLSIPDSAAIIYSLGYNATYMIPETTVLCAAAYYIGSVVDFTRELPERIARPKEDKNRVGLYLLSGAMLLLAVVVDVALIAPHTQDPETGKFDLGFLSEVSWVEVGVVTGVCVLVAVCSALYARYKANKEEITE